MEPNAASKMKYYLWFIIFHSLCVCGLIWQVWETSDNFFKFDVYKDINVFPPEQSSHLNKVLYICFSTNHIVDTAAFQQFTQYKQYQLKFGRKMPVTELKFIEIFKLTYKWNETFSYICCPTKLIDELIVVHPT